MLLAPGAPGRFVGLSVHLYYPALQILRGIPHAVVVKDAQLALVVHVVKGPC